MRQRCMASNHLLEGLGLFCHREADNKLLNPTAYAGGHTYAHQYTQQIMTSIESWIRDGGYTRLSTSEQ